MKHSIALLFLIAFTGCKKDVVEKCYTCDQFITYTTTSPTFIPTSPYTTSRQACTEDEKTHPGENSRRGNQSGRWLYDDKTDPDRLR